MACPFFMPAGRLDNDAWTNPPRLPLGDPYQGACHAHPAEVFEPPETALRDLCNCGYARGRCQSFPEDGAADAVRFSITDDRNGLVRLVYVVEKNHAPVEHGVLEYVVDQAGLLTNDISELLASQANAFLQSYLRRRI